MEVGQKVDIITCMGKIYIMYKIQGIPKLKINFWPQTNKYILRLMAWTIFFFYNIDFLDCFNFENKALGSFQSGSGFISKWVVVQLRVHQG